MRKGSAAPILKKQKDVAVFLKKPGIADADAVLGSDGVRMTIRHQEKKMSVLP